MFELIFDLITLACVAVVGGNLIEAFRASGSPRIEDL